MRHIPSYPVESGCRICPDCGARGATRTHTCTVWSLRMRVAELRERLCMRAQMLTIIRCRMPEAASLIDELYAMSPVEVEALFKTEKG